MKIYKGIDALPSFQEKKLLNKLRSACPDIETLSAEYYHFADISQKLTSAEEKELQTLLSYGQPFAAKRDGTLALAIPRPGTISPWSSKATDIIRNSGLQKIVRIERGTAYYIKSAKKIDLDKISDILHDRMTETLIAEPAKASVLFKSYKPRSVSQANIMEKGKQALIKANIDLGLALDNDEIEYLFAAYKELGRNPTDAELMMFALVNSEHCRHKIFNADWVIEGREQPKSLFKMIKNTYEKNSAGVLSAYTDNAAVLAGPASSRFYPNAETNVYGKKDGQANIVIKVETHNHPTAISPFPGSATGAGGEIRDEGATGRGAKPKIGLTGYSVSNLQIPGKTRPWEKNYGKPARIASPLDIMIEAPLGGADFNNEFGRPNLSGYFRTFESDYNKEHWGYHKPIMAAGGLGNIEDDQVLKRHLPSGAAIIIMGGPGMLIGLGGGAASSMQTGKSAEDLDFASVQRANAELQRRAQEVINKCISKGPKNPIISIHDVGAGGLSNALPEIVHDSQLGAKFELRDIPIAETGMSPMEIWCNESQERYVLAIATKDLPEFKAACLRERCPYAVVGTTTTKQELIVHDRLFKNNPIDLPMDVLFGKPPKMTRSFDRKERSSAKFDITSVDIKEAVNRALHLPAVASKKFLITIGDRNVGGLTARDQMIGPWQVPVSDVAVSSSGFGSQSGEALSMGERTPLAITNPAASARMAVGEALTNVVAANIGKLSQVKLSANWMAAAGFGQEDQALFDAVKTIGEDFCPELGITIPVGKDSLSMRTVWNEDGVDKSVSSPLSLIISAFAPVKSVAKTLTPQLQDNKGSRLILIDLGQGKNRMGGSALAQVYSKVGGPTPDADAKLLKKFFTVLQTLNESGKILAYHDRSDGGLVTTLCEMMFASRLGLEIDLAELKGRGFEKLFNEELGAVIQVTKENQSKVLSQLRKIFGPHVFDIGGLASNQTLSIVNGKESIYKNTRSVLEKMWAETSYNIQTLRDNPKTSEEEFNRIDDDLDPGLQPNVPFKLSRYSYKARPKVAILREQGVNGHVEMAAAFDQAGFTSVDVHLSDLSTGRADLRDFRGLAVCGGFSYGDVLGAGGGWAKSILFNSSLSKQFREFFERGNTFTLGVCNGCQMLSAMKELIPGAGHWPTFMANSSERFEARLVTVQVNETSSIFFKDMAGAKLPVPVAHGEGRAVFPENSSMSKVISEKLVPLQYVDNHGQVTEAYPLNPNGSSRGVTSLTSLDGRATILMPHPERAFLTSQFSWSPSTWSKDAPWFKIFQNARDWTS